MTLTQLVQTFGGVGLMATGIVVGRFDARHAHRLDGHNEERAEATYWRDEARALREDLNTAREELTAARKEIRALTSAVVNLRKRVAELERGQHATEAAPLTATEPVSAG